VLYRLVQQQLETWLAHRRESDSDGLPAAAHVERELRDFLACGILVYGFARARFPDCGHDFRVAFSCKGERLLRYCARPAFASERLNELGDERIRYTFSKPRPDGQTALTLTPPELLDRLAALVPLPRRHRHHYHGVFAQHAPLRTLVTARAGRTLEPTLAANRAATGGDTGVAVVAAPFDQSPLWDPTTAPSDPRLPVPQVPATVMTPVHFPTSSKPAVAIGPLDFLPLEF
jgi:hypothetical protein